MPHATTTRTELDQRAADQRNRVTLSSTGRSFAIVTEKAAVIIGVRLTQAHVPYSVDEFSGSKVSISVRHASGAVLRQAVQIAETRLASLEG